MFNWKIDLHLYPETPFHEGKPCCFINHSRLNVIQIPWYLVTLSSWTSLSLMWYICTTPFTIKWLGFCPWYPSRPCLQWKRNYSSFVLRASLGHGNFYKNFGLNMGKSWPNRDTGILFRCRAIPRGVCSQHCAHDITVLGVVSAGSHKVIIRVHVNTLQQVCFALAGPCRSYKVALLCGIVTKLSLVSV